MLKGQDPSLVMESGGGGAQAGNTPPSCNTPVHHQRAADSFASTSLPRGKTGGLLWAAGWGWHTENGDGGGGGGEEAAQCELPTQQSTSLSPASKLSTTPRPNHGKVDPSACPCGQRGMRPT